MTPDQTPTEPPLWSIAMAATIVLAAPLFLYSLAPTGPLREGDTVFSDGQQRVQLTQPLTNSTPQLDDTCLLDPNSPLIIASVSDDPTNSSIVARVQGNQDGEWPFCPVHAEVRLHSRQVFQNPAVFGAIREILTRWSAHN